MDMGLQDKVAIITGRQLRYRQGRGLEHGPGRGPSNPSGPASGCSGRRLPGYQNHH